MSETYCGRSCTACAQGEALGKWLWLLFWLVVPGNIAGVMKLDFVRQAAPMIYTAGRILSGACIAAYGAILLKLRGEDEKYWTAGICTLAEAGVLLLVALLAKNEKELGWQLVTLLAAIATIAGQYNEFGAHSAVLVGVDDGLAQKWTNLWKWFVGCTAAMVASILIVLFAPGFGLLVLLAGMIGIVVVSILKMVFLYRTAKVFRTYPAEGK